MFYGTSNWDGLSIITRSYPLFSFLLSVFFLADLLIIQCVCTCTAVTSTYKGKKSRSIQFFRPIKAVVTGSRVNTSENEYCSFTLSRADRHLYCVGDFRFSAYNCCFMFRDIPSSGVMLTITEAGQQYSGGGRIEVILEAGGSIHVIIMEVGKICLILLYHQFSKFRSTM